MPSPGDGKNEAKMIDMFFGPYKDTQALYVIKFGNHDTVLRIRYSGIHNEPPLVSFEFKDKYYDVGEEVQFDGSYSKDPEGDKLIFKWYFGDGEMSTKEKPIHTYKKPGAYKVELIVADSLNQFQQITKMIQIGTPPNINIISPTEEDKFYVGQLLRLKGETFYPNGTALGESNLEWEVRKHHSDHYHPFLDPTFGNDFDLFAAPKPEDFYASLNSYLEIFLRVTDENGLVAQTKEIIQPQLVVVDMKSNIPGVKILIEDEPISMPEEVWAWKEQKIHLKAENSPPYMFKSWSDGVRDPERVARLNYSNPTFEAIFCVDDGGICSVGSQICCIGECSADGICSVRVKLPSLYVDTTLLPTKGPMSSPTISSRPATNESAPTKSDDFLNSIQLNDNGKHKISLSISPAGKGMLSVTCLLISGIIASFIYTWKYGQQRTLTNPLQIEANENGTHDGENNTSPEECREEVPISSVTSSSSDNGTDTV